MEEGLKKIKIGYKLRFNFLDKGGLGPTGYNILYFLIRGHPLTHVAKKLDLSYRFVRGYLDKIERRCGVNIVQRVRGASGGTKIRPCGSTLYFLYRQLSTIMDLSCSLFERVVIGAPYRNVLTVRDGYVFGMLDVFGDVDDGDVLIVPQHKNSYRVRLTFKPKVIKKREINGEIVTTVAILEKTSLKEGKIYLDPSAIGIYRSSTDRRTRLRGVNR